MVVAVVLLPSLLWCRHRRIIQHHLPYTTILLCGNSQQHHYGVCRIEVMVLRWVYYGNPWCHIPNTGCCKIAHAISIYDVDYTTGLLWILFFCLRTCFSFELIRVFHTYILMCQKFEILFFIPFKSKITSKYPHDSNLSFLGPHLGVPQLKNVLLSDLQ